MPFEDIEEVFGQLKYRADERLPPDEARRERFHSGWMDSTERGNVYTDETLQRLTWQNLGYRLGLHYGPFDSVKIDLAFDVLDEHWHGMSGSATSQIESTVPTAEEYVTAFRGIGAVTDCQVQMLRVHYNSPARTITAQQLANAVGYSHFGPVNIQYGQLGRLVGDWLSYNPMQERLGTLVTFAKREGQWHWLLRPQVAESLEQLGWVEGTAILLPEEIEAATSPLFEGTACRVMVNLYERNPEARRRCLEIFGTSCDICGFNFADKYGDVADGYIHVHHLRPLSEVNGEYIVDPKKDLRPVCPNCHAVLHRRIPAYSIEEVREFMRR